MLSAADDLFHQPRFQDFTWTETSWWSFYIPEESRLGYLYFIFKPNLGVAQSQVAIWSGHCRDLTETDYWDTQIHLPMPRANLDNLPLASGLSLRVLEPLKRYRVDYDGGRGTELHLEFEALTLPAEASETTLDKGETFAKTFQAMVLIGAWHFDQPVMAKGELILNGERHEVAYPAIRDRSWGPRPETGLRAAAYDQGHFGSDFGFHVLGRLPSLQECPPFEGYILEAGQIHPLTAAKGQCDREGRVPRRIVYELTDSRGKTFVFRGEAMSSLPHTPILNWISYSGLARWECNGRIGWGDFTHTWPIAAIQEERRATLAR